jgi:hydroxyethylthiazole kinase
MSRMSRTPEDLLSFTLSTLDEVRLQAPLVQCLTNSVVVNFTANALLALGAAPAMVDIAEEAGPFARVAGGVLVNLGTPGAEQREAMLEAVTAASEAGTPWVLDPVAIGSLPVRTSLALTLRDQRPTIVRGNASEIIALAGRGDGGRGVDAADEVEAALPAARSLAEETGAVVAVSGPVDLVTDGRELVRIANGHPLLTQVTGGGCALGAVMAAFAAVDEDRFAATVAAATVYTVAAEIAAEGCTGPGTFATGFLDALADVGPADVAKRAMIS